MVQETGDDVADLEMILWRAIILRDIACEQSTVAYVWEDQQRDG